MQNKIMTRGALGNEEISDSSRLNSPKERRDALRAYERHHTGLDLAFSEERICQRRDRGLTIRVAESASVKDNALNA
jgi:hypothetical protein